MESKCTKRYTEEFKRDAIALVDSSGKTVTAIAREFGISSESLRGWYRRAKADRGEGAPGRADQRRARGTAPAAQREPRAAADDRDPEKATSFFVRENDR
ncbi:hypothetical protein CIB93_22240 [Streptomyces sp. WZ.A104]|uniref:transposase n=1 Tax=Streptomyces sp. WZ.A104 TaxID=2023771 RepID=UPI000BBC9054|nr:hypothetical protein CIB93_22240 [Streptomyces sp. WZ.A104]